VPIYWEYEHIFDKMYDKLCLRLQRVVRHSAFSYLAEVKLLRYESKSYIIGYDTSDGSKPGRRAE
jgi:hypothetical protein